MKTDPGRLIVIEDSCHACDVHTVQVYHQHFPELRLEGLSVEQAADHLAERLTASLDNVSDPSQVDAVKEVLMDIAAFLDNQGPVHTGRDA